ncbi:hypothetical protein GCM10023147_21270 [Tsukamurella soli]|uniref:ER-bound oxygenase mpaB/mpaB'/Rubber oxygenase catalytic domain-containing protein n=1 Tax=Tsukamurella soli TaxID=644556 RepID=A0ABP8JKM4_9ACTN
MGASEHLTDVHAKATGIEPVAGRRYAANNPASQLWIHVTGWHSVLKCYEMYGPGPLSASEEARYWRDCVVAAELQTCDPAAVPTSRDEVRQYFAHVRPSLCLTERGRRAMHYLLRTDGHGPRVRIGSSLLAPATIATLPAWMREMGGFEQWGVIDRGYRLPVRATMGAFALRNGQGTAAFTRLLAPHTADILRRHRAQGAEPAGLDTVTPAAARQRYGRRTAAV